MENHLSRLGYRCRYATKHVIAFDDSTDWPAQWASIDSFVSDWLSVEFSRDVASSDIEQLCGDLTLPPSAREWIAFALASQHVTNFTFRDCLVVESVPGHDAVSLLIQGEADYYWAIESRRVDEPNPPVEAYILDYESDETRFESAGMWAPTVTAFALDYFLSYLQSPGGGFAVRHSSEYFDKDQLVADFGSPLTFGHLELFYLDGVLAILGGLPPSWRHNVLNVEIQTKRPFKRLPSSVQKLVKGAHVTHGGMHKHR